MRLRSQRIVACAELFEWLCRITPAWAIDDLDAGSSELVDDRLLCDSFLTLVS
jgi:hypothetical protein